MRLERAVKALVFSRPDVSFKPLKRLVWTAFPLLCFYVWMKIKSRFVHIYFAFRLAIIIFG